MRCVAWTTHVVQVMDGLALVVRHARLAVRAKPTVKITKLNAQILMDLAKVLSSSGCVDLGQAAKRMQLDSWDPPAITLVVEEILKWWRTQSAELGSVEKKTVSWIQR